MARQLEESLAWMRSGTGLFLSAVDGLDAADFDAPSDLPGWSRKYLVAHIAANADALRNLVHWAATGEETPMYASPEERSEDIESGARRPANALRSRAHSASEQLASDLAALDQKQWQEQVRTAQGRMVPAADVPWMRAREVFVHAVDLGTGLGLADLPEDFVRSLIDDMLAKRGMDTAPDGPLPDVAAYLAGRPHTLTGVPELGPWL
jgi:maleylpyruvate isomerase